ncbi:MAG: hypothetical protein KIS96_12935 [Bauldia sp.]|nr:hypothetical protein [Bauldia sp.]
MRAALINVLLFLVPFVAYAIWLLATRGRLNDRADWTLRVLGILAGVGAVIMIIGLVFIVDWTGESDANPGSYRPAEVRDGVLIPGGFFNDDE